MIIALGTTPAVQLTMSFSAVKTDAVNRAAEVRRYASGKSINAVRVLRTLGHEVCALGFAGGGPGGFVRSQLTVMGAAHDLVEVNPDTRTCVTVIDRSNATATELIEEPARLPADDYRALLSSLQKVIGNSSALLLAGSLPPGAPPAFYADCLAAVPAGAHTVIDAKGETLTLSLRHRPTVVKPNRRELWETVGREIRSDSDMKLAIRQMIALGPRWVVVTDGPRPAAVSDGSQFFWLTSPRVAVVSPIGSGDSFAAGLVAGLCDGRSVLDACKLAAACGSANAMTDIPGGLTLANVNALEQRVDLTAF